MSAYEISVEDGFKARHAVRLAEGFERPHEHAWRVTATFRADRLSEPMGVVVDFVDVQTALRALVGELEGKNLNELEAFAGRGASAERLAEFLAGQLRGRIGGARLHCLAVIEAPGCGAAFYPGG